MNHLKKSQEAKEIGIKGHLYFLMTFKVKNNFQYILSDIIIR